MPGSPNKLSQFWQELKRRRVVHVITVYAGAAYVIIELVNNVYETLNLPDWTPALTLIILAIGFPLAIILSWIFDVTPEGIEKTKTSKEVGKDEKTATPNSWKIATYVSIAIIVGLITFNIFRAKEGARIDESLEKSIAIMPFHNFLGDPDQDPMCDGLTDEIINHLYKIQSFDKIVSLTSVLRYKHSDKTIPQIAEELGVNYILECTYKRIENTLRVSAKLIESGRDNHIWQNNYDQPYEKVMIIPADIALQIAEHLKTFIADSEHIKIERIPTNSLEAYEVLKQAGYLLNLQGPSAATQALEIALEAIKIDPEYADAYATAGILTLWKGVYAGGSEIQSAAMEALPFFEKALELDQNNASAHNGMGYVNEWARWDYINAEKEYLKAIELEPNNSVLYFGPIEFFLEMHRLEDLFLLIEESPGEQNFDNARINSHILSGHKKEANKLITQMVGDEREHRWVGESYLWLDEYDSAKFYLESAIQSEHSDMTTPRFQAYLALVYEKTNNHLKARTIVNQLIAKSDTTSVGSPAYFTGWYYSGIGEVDSAFYWLEKAYNNRSPELPWLKVDPAFNNLLDDDRYWDLYERTGHKAYDDYMASKSK